MERFLDLKKQVLKLEFEKSLKLCLNCDDKFAKDACISHCTEDMNLRILQVFMMQKELGKCAGNRRCESKVVGRLEEVYQNEF
jgi:hypothetical protein